MAREPIKKRIVNRDAESAYGSRGTEGERHTIGFVSPFKIGVGLANSFRKGAKKLFTGLVEPESDEIHMYRGQRAFYEDKIKRMGGR